jgi:glycerol uptake facilitator-like aquaporin
VEGAIHTTLPILEQFFSGGMLEIVAQSFLFSTLLFYWVNNPQKRWMNWLLGILFALVVLMSLMGYLAASGTIPVPA